MVETRKQQKKSNRKSTRKFKIDKDILKELKLLEDKDIDDNLSNETVRERNKERKKIIKKLLKSRKKDIINDIENYLVLFNNKFEEKLIKTNTLFAKFETKKEDEDNEEDEDDEEDEDKYDKSVILKAKFNQVNEEDDEDEEDEEDEDLKAKFDQINDKEYKDDNTDYEIYKILKAKFEKNKDNTILKAKFEKSKFDFDKDKDKDKDKERILKARFEKDKYNLPDFEFDSGIPPNCNIIPPIENDCCNVKTRFDNLTCEQLRIFKNKKPINSNMDFTFYEVDDSKNNYIMCKRRDENYWDRIEKNCKSINKYNRKHFPQVFK